MRTYLHIWLLRFRLWRIFGLPFGTSIPAWRVIVRKRNTPGKPWYFYTRLDGPPFAGRADLEIGPVGSQSLGMWLPNRDPQLDTVLKLAAQQWQQTNTDFQRFQAGEYRPFEPPPAPPPSSNPPEPTVAGHEKQWTAELNGIVCQCEWRSKRSRHTLHLADGTCAECREVWQQWWHHLAKSFAAQISDKERPTA